MKSFLMKFTSKHLSNFFLITSIIALFYLIYRERIFHEGQLFSYYLNYYIAVLVIIFFSLFSFLLSKNFKANFILVACSLIFAFFLIEFFLIYQFSYESKSIKKYIEENQINYDIRSKEEVYLKLKETDSSATVSISPATFIDNKILSRSKIYPLSGISNSKTIFCNELGYWATYDSDRYGFKNPNEEWDKKENLEFVFIGDSFTQGACVNTDDDIAGNVRKFLEGSNKNSGVLNFGFRGQGPLGEYALLREYLPEVKTKRVVLIYFENDLGNLMNEYRQKFLLNYLNDINFKQNLILKNEEKDKFLRSIVQKILNKRIKYSNSFFNKYIIKLVKLENVRKIFLNTQPTVSDEYKDILKKTKSLVEENNSKMYFVYLPSHKKYQKSFLKRTIWTKLRGPIENHSFNSYNEVINLVKSMNIPLIDLHQDLFKSMDDPMSVVPFRGNGHFNEEGYYLVAKKIFDKIIKLEKNDQ